MVRNSLILLAVAGMTLFFMGGCMGEKTDSCTGACTGLKPYSEVAKPVSADFYKADGSFDADKALDAYFAMMKAFKYPVPQALRDQIWTADFVSGDFASIGMAGIFWINEKGVYGETGAKQYDGKYAGQNFGYLGHDIYLLPGQALPEHHHIEDVEGFGPKMEAWKITHGSVTFYGEVDGGNGEKLISELPEDQRPWGYGEEWFKCKYYITKQAGEVYVLKDPESWHFQQAGPDGAIVAEFATYHNHVSFSRPGMVFASTEAK